MKKNNRYEVLAPVGNEEMFYSAIASGADAIYMAGNKFGARAYASNFSLKEIKKIVEYAHLRGVKVYITVNTLIKERELGNLYDYIKDLYYANVDAIIVQDYGLYNMVKKYFPDFEIHASTQMAVNNLQGALKLKEMKVDRLVVGREVDFSEIEKIHKFSGIEIEAFIHGSLCVAVSGQCYISSLIGGRSGNRGRCAQPCRKTYDIYLDNGRKINSISDSFISGRDLNLIEEIDTMKEIGVYSYKIEGRMKKPEYVYNTVKQYKKALSGKRYDEESFSLVSNRKFTKGLAYGDFGKKYYNPKNYVSGEEVANIIKDKDIYLLANKDLNRGDIISVKSERGNRFNLTLTKDIKKGEKWILTRYSDLENKSPVYRIFSQKMVEDLAESLDKEYKKKIDISLKIESGREIQGQISMDSKKFTVNSDFIVDQAKKRPISEDIIKEQLSRLGNTIYELESWTIYLEEEVFIPLSYLNDYRRKFVDILDNYILDMNRKEKIDMYQAVERQNIQRENKLSYEYISKFNKDINFELIDRVYTHDIRSIESLKTYYNGPIYFIFPRIMYEGDYIRLKTIIDDNIEDIDGFSINSLGDLNFVQKNYNKPIHAEAWMNLMNSEAIDFLRNQGISSLSLSHEMNIEEILELDNMDMVYEIQTYGRIPQMLMKYCPASPIKNCQDSSACDTCNFRKNINLKNNKDILPFVRNFGYTEVLTEKKINLFNKFNPDIKIGYLRIVDREDEIIPDIINNFYTLFIERIDKDIKSNKKEDYTLGHFNKGVL